MTRRSLRNVAASVRTKLLNRSRATDEDYQFLLQRYAAERFLHRLGESEHRSRFVLKGAMLLALWGEATYRPTRDLDFTGYGDSHESSVRSAIRTICSVPVVDDGVVFDVETLNTAPIREHAEYSAVRARLWTRIGSARIPVRIDIGFGNAIRPPPTDTHYPTLLTDSPQPWIRAYPTEAVVAEKLHAMVSLGELNSRYKDFYDLYNIARYLSFDGDRLSRSIGTTFDCRNAEISPDLPPSLGSQFYDDPARGEQWRAYLLRNSLPGAPQDFGIVGDLIQLFLVVPWQALARCSIFSGVWTDGGPWRVDDGAPHAVEDG